MKSHLLQAIKLTIVCIIFFVGVYTLLVWSVGQLVDANNGNGETIRYAQSGNDQSYGFANVGQAFTADKYFWSRPSAVGYNASGSGASNKGPSNKEYLEQVQARIDTFMAHNPSVNKADIPVEMVTASGSGLDPHISIKSAVIQVARIAKERNLTEDKIITLINKQTEKPFLGMFGPSQVNVLKLNIELNNLNL